MHAIISYDAPPGKHEPAVLPLDLTMRDIVDTLQEAIERVEECAKHDRKTAFVPVYDAPDKLTLDDETPLETQSESGYFLRWATAVGGVACMYLVRKKPDGYLLSGAVRVRPVRFYSIVECSVSDSDAETSSSSSESDEATPCVQCGKSTVHFHHNAPPPPLPFLETPQMTRNQRRRNRRNRKK